MRYLILGIKFIKVPKKEVDVDVVGPMPGEYFVSPRKPNNMVGNRIKSKERKLDCLLLRALPWLNTNKRKNSGFVIF